MPLNTQPGFMSRLGSQMPGMMNALAQNYGSPGLRRPAAMSGAVYGAYRQKKREQSKPAAPTPTPTTEDSSQSTESNQGIVTPPREFRGGRFSLPGLWNPNAPKLDPNTGQYTTPGLQIEGPGFGGMRPPMMGMPGMWNVYNRLVGTGADQTRVPGRQIFF